MRTVVLIIIYLALLSCKKEPAKTIIVEEPEHTQLSPATKYRSKLERLTSQFMKNRDEVLKKLKLIRPQEANKLFEEYEKANNELVGHINKAEEVIITDYYSYYFDNNGNPKPVTDSLRQKKELLQKAQLEFWDIGEGMAEIRPVHNFYYNIFKDYVTPDYREFLRLESIDDSVLWAADAGIIIPWAQLGIRVINWENFLKKYPDSNLADLATLHYAQYQYSYLFGMDNTSTFEYNDVNLYPEMIVEFNRFVAEFPESPTAKLAQEMLDSNGKGFEQLRETLQKRDEEIYNKFYNEQ